MQTRAWAAWRQTAMVVGLWAIAQTAPAVDRVKADNTTALNLVGSWAGGVAPGTGDVGTWDNTVTAANTVSLGASLDWGGLRLGSDGSAPGGDVTLTGAFSLALRGAGLDVGATRSFTFQGASLNISSADATLAGATTITVDGTGSDNWSRINNVTFSGTLVIGGASYANSVSSMNANWVAFGAASGATQTGSFGLNTGSATDKGDFIVTDAWNGRTLTLSSLSGNGNIRCDWGNAGTRTLKVLQAGTTTFSGFILAHYSSGGASRNLKLVKDGAGALILTGVLGKQTASAGGGTPVLGVDVDAGILNINPATGGTGFTGGNDTLTGDITIRGGAELRAFRNGKVAFGSGTLQLQGGMLAPEQGNWTWTNPIQLAAATTSTIGNRNTGSNRSLKLQGVMAGSGNVEFADTTGTMTSADLGFILTGANTLSGTVTILNGAKVRVGGVPGEDASTAAGTAGALGTAAVENNGTLTFSRSNAHTVANNIGGSGSVRVGSTGIAGTETQDLTLSGDNTYAGATVVANGTLRVGSGGATGSLGAGNVTVNGALVVNRSNDLTLGNPIDGSGSLTKQGAGKLTLTGANTYGGTTTVNAGTLELGATGVLTPGNHVVLNGGTLQADVFANSIGTLDLDATSSLEVGAGAGTLMFADSSARLWAGTLNVIGTLGATTLRFGTTAAGLTPAQLQAISVNGAPADITDTGYIFRAAQGTVFIVR